MNAKKYDYVLLDQQARIGSHRIAPRTNNSALHWNTMTVAANGRNRNRNQIVPSGETIRDQRFQTLHSCLLTSRFKTNEPFRVCIRKRFQKFSILAIHCLILLGCQNTNTVFWERSLVVVVSAWEMTTTRPSIASQSQSFSLSGRSSMIGPSAARPQSDGAQMFTTTAAMGPRTVTTLSQSSSQWTEQDRSNNNVTQSNNDNNNNNNMNETEPTGDDDPVGWRSQMPRDQYASPLLWETRSEWESFMTQFRDGGSDGVGDSDEPKGNEEDAASSTSRRKDHSNDHLWEQVKLEALSHLGNEPEAGPQLYQNILSQGSLLEAIVSIVANEVETELIKATEIKKVFLDMLTEEDEESIHCDVIAAATRSPSVELAVLAVLFHTGLHAMVCYRVGHRLWKVDRTGLAKYLQSTVSRHYSADIHPACSMGQGIYLCTASGVVIGETATVGNDVSILHGVTLGGTGKELGDRHPKVQNGVILKDCATVLGNIPVGTGAVVMAKAIVNKPVPPLAITSGVPAKVIDHRVLEPEAFHDDLEEHLAFKYLDEWRELRRTLDK